MPKNILLTLILSLNVVVGYCQSGYCRLLEKKRAINFYWDWHYEYNYKVNPGVFKEIIYHQVPGSKDSVLEREIIYNMLGLPITDRQFAVPSKEGVISEDNFFYDTNHLLIRINRHYLNCVLGKVAESVVFDYDEQNREITKIQDGPNGKYIETIYETGRMIKREHYPTGTMDTNAIHFYSAGREDSMQVFQFRKWVYTTVFRYDSLANTQMIYLRHQNGTMLRSRYQFNPDGSLHSLLIKNLPNWNQTKELDVEYLIEYNTDKSVGLCTFFIKGKKLF